jgi:ABC-type antimicrobial peptide transport system permease subunit
MEQGPSSGSVGPWRSGWRRLRRDRGGMLALIAVVVLLMLCLLYNLTLPTTPYV